MQRISTKMKLLSLAILGLGGIALAGSASAATCPSTPDAWTNSITGGGGTMAIGQPGMNGTNCKLELTIGTLSNTRAAVIDDSPSNEPRYRARFYLDLSNIASVLTVANRQTQILTSYAASSPGVGISTNEVRMILLGSGSGPAIRMKVADASQPSNFRTITTVLPSSANNQYRIEFDLTQGTGPDNFRYWVTAAATATSDGSPTGTATIDTTGWSGVTGTNMGLFGTTPNFRSAASGITVSFDEFDSRRQTFIGQ